MQVIFHSFENMESDRVDVLVFGSAIMDFICYVEHLPMAGETLHGYKFSTGFGGKGANQCVAAARLGVRTGLIAKLGCDMWGDDYLKQMQKENININYLKQCRDVGTGIAQITVSQNGENHIVIVAGANNELAKDDVWSAKNLFQDAKILLCQLEAPIDGTLEALRSFKGISILNAAPAMVDIPLDLIQSASILCVNEHEAATMTKRATITTLLEAKSAALKLVEMGTKCAIITLGCQGAVYIQASEPNKCVHVAAYKVNKVVDTTGAGDAFLGALAYQMACKPHLNLYQHVGFACRVAAYSIQYLGTQASYPQAKDVEYLSDDSYTFNLI